MFFNPVEKFVAIIDGRISFVHKDPFPNFNPYFSNSLIRSFASLYVLSMS